MTDVAPAGIAVDRKEVTPLTITVLAGGPSSEREVSLESGRAVTEALGRIGHTANMCDIQPDDLSALDEEADFVFIALHGEFGEDGQVQAILEARGLPYSGCGVASSRLAMNKVGSKQRLLARGVPTAPFEHVVSASLDGLGERFAAPAVVKPVAAGSSVDTFIVRDKATLQAAADEVVGKYGEALVERFINGPELTVGVVGDLAVPVCQIVPAGEFYDYHAKYVADDTKYLFDIDLPAELLSRLQAMGLEAHAALGCEVFSRVDWMVDAATLEPYVLEINTIPGFTSHSLLPKAAARVGLGFEKLCQRIIDLSLATPRG